MARFISKLQQAKQVIYIACSLLFVSFSLLYLVGFQADALAMVQHVMSQGRTTYHVLTFSSLIVLILAALPFVQAKYLRVPIRAIGMLWLPSFALLGWLTDVGLSEVDPTSNSVGAIPFVLLGILYVSGLFLLFRIQEPKEPNTPLVNLLWPNLLIFSCGIAFTTYVGNTNQTIHYELRMERLINEEKYEDVLDVCANDDNPSRCTMSSRAYALSQLNKLGDRLFHYPCRVGGQYILPPPTDSLRPTNMPAKLKEYLGGYPIHDMNATHYLQYLASDSTKKEPVKDYLLCSLLLDKDLHTFVDSLIVYYHPKDSDSVDLNSDTRDIPSKGSKNKKKKDDSPIVFNTLPRHFAEALFLYMRQTENPIAVLKDDEIRENYLGFLEYFQKEKEPGKREMLCREYYGNTYWTFYFFTK